jgi:HK97 family phage portal protein
MLFNEDELNSVNDGRENNKLQEVISRESKYPSFTTVNTKPIYAQNSHEIRVANRNQEDIKTSQFYQSEMMFSDAVGASFYILKRLYKENSWVNLAVDVSAFCASSSMPLFKIKSKSGKKNIVSDLTDLFNYPNRNEYGWSLVNKTFKSLKKYGNSFWQVIRSRDGSIHSIYFLPTEYIRAIPFINKETNILEYCYVQLNYYQQRVDRVFFQDEVVHFKMPNDDGITYGMSEVVPLFKEITFDLEAKNWINSWFQKTFSGGMIFEMKNANKDVVKRNRAEMREKFEGSDNAGRNLILEGEMELVYDGNKAKDFDLRFLKEISRDDILTCLKVPLSVCAVRSNNGTANLEVINAESDAMLRNNVQVLQRILIETINLQIFRGILENRDIEMKAGTNGSFSNKNASNIVQSASKFAGTTINENRTILGLPTVEDDVEDSNFNKPLVSTNNSIVPLNDLFNSLENGDVNIADPNAMSLDKKVADKQKSVVVSTNDKKLSYE